MKSENINELAVALSKAQAEMGPAHKGQKNPFFKSNYADLNDIWQAAREPLTNNGLSIVQTMNMQDGVLMLTATLLHQSGQWIQSTAPIITEKTGPQALGSCITYIRRYTLAALIGIVTDIDDDGNKGSNLEKPKTPEQKTQNKVDTAKPEFSFVPNFKETSSAVLCSEKQAGLIRAKMAAKGWDKEKQDRFLISFGCKNDQGPSAKLILKDLINQVLFYLDTHKD